VKTTVDYIRKMVLALFLTITMNPLCHTYQNKIVAYVNYDIITSFDVEARSNILQSLKKKVHNSDEILQFLIDEVLVSHFSEKEDIKVSPKEIDISIKDIVSLNKLNSIEEFVKNFNLDEQELRNYFKYNILLSKIIRYRIQPEINISHQEVMKILINSKNNSTNHAYGRLELSEIVINKKNSPKQLIKRSIQEIYELLTKGKSFEFLVKNFSQGSTVEDKGYLGWLTVEDLEDNIFEVLKKNFYVGAVTPPIETKDNILILKINNISKNQSLGQNQIKGIRYDKKIEDELSNFIKNLREKSNIKIIY